MKIVEVEVNYPQNDCIIYIWSLTCVVYACIYLRRYLLNDDIYIPVCMACEDVIQHWRRGDIKDINKKQKKKFKTQIYIIHEINNQILKPKFY